MPKQPTASAEHFRPDMPETPGPGRRHFLRRCALLLPLLSACATQYRPGNVDYRRRRPDPRLLATNSRFRTSLPNANCAPDPAPVVFVANSARRAVTWAKPAVEIAA